MNVKLSCPNCQHKIVARVVYPSWWNRAWDAFDAAFKKMDEAFSQMDRKRKNGAPR